MGSLYCILYKLSILFITIYNFILDIAYQVLVDSTKEIKENFSGEFSDFADKLLEMNVFTEREKSTITDKYTVLDKICIGEWEN